MRATWVRLAAQVEPNQAEAAIQRHLDGLGIPYEFHRVIGPYCVDFYLPGYHGVLECDGGFWHQMPGRPERDRKRDGWMQKHGYQVARLAYTGGARRHLAEALSEVLATFVPLAQVGADDG
jgi:very-short-patch-repair endonuclease